MKTEFTSLDLLADKIEKMNTKFYPHLINKILCVLILLCYVSLSKGQQTPYYPISYRVFSPFIFNPAIAGSKDFSTVDVQISNYGKSNSQIASGNFRLTKSKDEYVTSIKTPDFTNIGLGGYLFNDMNGLSRNIGAGISADYHLQMDKKALSFLSFGVSAKGVYNKYSGDPDLEKPSKNTFFPNIDAGVYYYSANLFAGISGTNLLGNPEDPDSLGFYSIPVSRQFFLQVGYKFVLSRSKDILLEPSLIVNSDDSFSGEILDMLKPALKLYAGNFCLGTYFNDFDRISLFLQYKYPKFYIGTYFELPYNSAYYKNPILAELTFGINISAIKTGFTRGNHW
jgi:type IX secretion system PorP/SprF family membrane protein